MRGYTTMIKILFVCHGNICRSTMSQSVFTYLIRQAGLEDCFEIDSAATSREEIHIEVGCLFFCQLVAVGGSQKIGSLLCLDFAASQFAIIILFLDIFVTDVYE